MAADRHILIERNPGEWRLALLTAGRLSRLEILHDHAADRTGDILLARISAINPGIRALFADIGDGRDGFLSFQDARWLEPGNKGDRAPAALTEGASAILQVTRDGEGGKGARLTADISLAGTLLVYRPRGEGLQVSKKIAGQIDRDALAEALEGEGGFIFRTGAATAPMDDLVAEAADLRQRWADIVTRSDGAKPPAVLAQPASGIAGALLRAGISAGDSVTVDSDATAATIREHLQGIDAVIGICRAPVGPFETIPDPRDSLDSLLSPVVPLPSGGRLMIQRTGALTAIDVDSAAADGGQRPARETVNREAAAEIPRQLSLRGIGGLVLVDFILDRDREPDGKLLAMLRDGLGREAAGGRVTGITPSGLVEIVRPKSGAPLDERLTETRRHASPVAAVLACLAEARRLVRTEPGARFHLRADRAHAALLSGALAPALRELEGQIYLAVKVSADLADGGSIIIEREG